MRVGVVMCWWVVVGNVEGNEAVWCGAWSEGVWAWAGRVWAGEWVWSWVGFDWVGLRGSCEDCSCAGDGGEGICGGGGGGGGEVVRGLQRLGPEWECVIDIPCWGYRGWGRRGSV